MASPNDAAIIPRPAKSVSQDDRGQPPKATTPSHISRVQPPWSLKGDVYFFSFWTPKSVANNLPPMAFSPLEASSSFADPAISKPLGGLSMLQIIRYKDSPVGPYDEFIIVPGYFSSMKEDKEGRRVQRKGPKISRIYVSQKETCYNGRLNWNVPKHLAKFIWTTNPDKSTSVEIFPQDTEQSYTSSIQPASSTPESKFSSTPFFRATFKPIPCVPSFPFAMEWIKYFGFDPLLVQPPLPQGIGSEGELAGTEKWQSVMPLQKSRNCKIGWMDIRQNGQGAGEASHKKEPSTTVGGTSGREGGEFENFWPGLGRWQFAVMMEDASVTFDHPEETWDSVRSNL